MNQSNKHTLGLVASGKRNVKNGSQYDYLFPAANLRDQIINPNGTVKYTVEQMEKVVQDYNWQTKKLAKFLQANNIAKTLENIWNFFYNHYQYKLDADGVEQLRTPARAWHDGQILSRNPNTAGNSGIDCDCFSISVASVLTNLNIPHKLRVTKYSAGWQHVYVVVPVPGKPNYNWIIDCVLDSFNTEKTYTDKFDYNMSGLGIPVEILSGINDANEQHAIISGADINLEGFNGTDDDLAGDEELSGDDAQQILASAEAELGALKRHLQRTRAYIARNPESVVFQGGARNNIQRLDYVLAHWDTPNRMAALNEAARSEHEVNLAMGFAGPDDFDPLDGADDASDLSGILEEDEMGNLGFVDGLEGDDDAIDGLGKPKKGQKLMQNVRKAAGNVAKKVNVATTKVATVAKKAATNTATAAKKAGAKVAAAKPVKKVVKVTKKVAKKVGTATKKAVKAVVRYNPVTAAARGGYLLFLRTGLLGVAKALRPGYFATAQEAKNAGVSEADWQVGVKALARVKKIFVDTLQGKEANLKEAILKGAAKKGLKGFEGLGDPATTTAITAAAPPIVATGAALKDAGSKENFVQKIAEFFKKFGKNIKGGIQKIKDKRAAKKAKKTEKAEGGSEGGGEGGGEGSAEGGGGAADAFNKIITTANQAAKASGGGGESGGGESGGGESGGEESGGGTSSPQGRGSGSGSGADGGGESGGGSNAGGGAGGGDKETMFSKALNFAKENPVKTVVGVLGTAALVTTAIVLTKKSKKSKGLSGAGKKKAVKKRRIVSPNTSYQKRKVKYIKM